MQHWAGLYESEKGVRIIYKKGGSSAGVKGMTDRSLDFACTDAPMTEKELANARAIGGEVVHIPLALGAVVPTYKLPDVGKTLRFTGPLLADIYLGKVTNWNDQAIVVNNPGQKLPNLPITVVHRAEGSGTTFIWTDFLTKASPAEWGKRVGTGTVVKWPVGVKGKGNDGVATVVSRTEGAIGYVELTYALGNSLPAGHVKNKDGLFIRPSLKSVTAAATGALERIPDDLRFSLTDAPGEDAYPIAGTVWAVLYVNQPAKKGTPLVRFLEWVTRQGQEHMSELRYAPLPATLGERVKGKLKRIRVGS
jgi:phosphate transport system substrate-binding protein